MQENFEVLFLSGCFKLIFNLQLLASNSLQELSFWRLNFKTFNAIPLGN